MDLRMPRISRSVITGAAVPGQSGVTLLARVRGSDGRLITQASLSSIAYTVSDLTNGESLGTGTFTISSTVYDSLQQGDPRWSADSAARPGADGSHGYNFAGELPASLFALTTLAEPGVLTGPADPIQVQADVAFTPASGQAFRMVWSWKVWPVYG